MKDLDNALKDAYLNLETDDHSPFSIDGYRELKIKISELIVQLFDESIRTAKRSKVEIVSPPHVQKAADYLVKKPHSKKSSLINIVGGLFLGATLSNIISMIVYSGEYPKVAIFITIVLGIAGAFMLGINLAKDY